MNQQHHRFGSRRESRLRKWVQKVYWKPTKRGRRNKRGALVWCYLVTCVCCRQSHFCSWIERILINVTTIMGCLN